MILIVTVVVVTTKNNKAKQEGSVFRMVKERVDGGKQTNEDRQGLRCTTNMRLICDVICLGGTFVFTVNKSSKK